MLIAGCGLVVETDRDQCKSADDCAKALGGAAASYMCQEGLCTTLSSCTPETVAQSCGDSPTVQCVNGQCVDPIWGCWNEPDNRPAPTRPTVDLSLKFVSVFTQSAPAALTGVACRTPTIDLMCAAALPGTTTAYDPVVGRLSVSGISVMPFYSAYRIKVDAPPSAMLQPIDYASNRPPRDGDPEPAVTMLPTNIADFLPRELNIDPAKGNVVLRIHDCNGELAAGVEATMVDPPADLGRLYTGSTGEISTEQTTTSSQGLANLFNVPVEPVTLIVKISPTKEIRYAARAFAGRYSFIDLYPRRFE